ncbi:MAG: TIGR02300 family protein [Alphaproteobacteria bacterium]
MKPEWGSKRLCQNCGARFYDLKRDPIVCPRCDMPYVAPAPAKPRRAATPAKPSGAPRAALRPIEAIVTVEAAPPDDEVAVVAIETDDEHAGQDIIEDASELGEDEDDMAEVIESGHEEPEDER